MNASVLNAALSSADLLASATLVGGFIYGALVAPPSPKGRRILCLCVVGVGLVLVAEVVLNAYRMWRISGIGGVALWRDVADMRWTRFWALRCAGVVLLGAALALSRGIGVPAAILAIGWLGLRALQGHAGAHGAAAAAVDWAHLTAASAWLGALVQFAVAESGSATALWRLSDGANPFNRRCRPSA